MFQFLVARRFVKEDKAPIKKKYHTSELGSLYDLIIVGIYPVKSDMIDAIRAMAGFLV